MESTLKFAFPLFVRLDDGEVMQIESYDRILRELEAIDIENDEYQFWDANGHGVKVLIERSRVSGLQSVENPMTLQEAISAYAAQLETSLEPRGTPQEIWAKLLAIKGRIPDRRGFFSRLFGHTTK